MSELSPEWKDGQCKDITFIVTKDCQLACKYCYLVGKNTNERMSWETAKKTVDYILSQKDDELFKYESVVFNFIGGEPFLEIELIDRICDYLKIQMYLLNHHWFNSYRFSITTNGINYDSPKVQEFIRKNHRHLSVTITIDGTPSKHNINRIWKMESLNAEGRGSYDDVVRNIPLWLRQFPNAATKVTISSADIPYIKESVLHLFDLGIHMVYINCVFENVWKDGDDSLFEGQLRNLADEMLQGGRYKEYGCSLFDRSIGQPMDNRRDSNWCGAGLMLAVDAGGNLYPCTRFVKYSLREKPARMIGHIDTGVDKNRLRPFYSLSRSLQSTKECIECDVASGCAWCQGENYDCSDTRTIFQRSTAICKMHKARVRANRYYWAKVDAIEGVRTDNLKTMVDNTCTLDKHIEVPECIVALLSSDATSFCIKDNDKSNRTLMPIEVLRYAVDGVEKYGWSLQFVFPDYKLPDEYLHLINTVPHKRVVPFNSNQKGDVWVINTWDEIRANVPMNVFCILRTTLMDFYQNIDQLDVLFHKVSRLNIVFVDEISFSVTDESRYQNALERLIVLIHKFWKKNRQVYVNLITDRLHLTEMFNCDAGWKFVTLAPNGKFYICPSFYYDDEDDTCGDVERGICIKNQVLFKLNHAPYCRLCAAYQCERCVYLNNKKTLEVNVPSFEQCKKAAIELEATKKFYALWKNDESM